MPLISILIPVFNEEKNLPLLYRELTETAGTQSGYDWRFWFVDDGSTDQTPDILGELRQQDGRVNYIRLSRNFGKENAILAGLDHVRGEICIIMDGDLQHPAAVIPEMLRRWEEGYQDVYARRRDRNDEPWAKRTLTRLYYRLLQQSSRFDVLPDVGDFRLLDRRCVLALRQLREQQRYTKGLFAWIGYRKCEIPFDCRERHSGRSTFSLGRLFELAIDGITSFTTSPLRISAVTGLVVSLAAFVYLCFIVVKTLVIGEAVQGFPTLVCILLFFGGVQLLSIGILGEYVGRIFNETKRRPIYLIDHINGQTPDEEIH
ncbi:MAG: glycosyltransferase family 2 protein [Alloprevotella sp.]